MGHRSYGLMKSTPLVRKGSHAADMLTWVADQHNYIIGIWYYGDDAQCLAPFMRSRLAHHADAQHLHPCPLQIVTDVKGHSCRN